MKLKIHLNFFWQILDNLINRIDLSHDFFFIANVFVDYKLSFAGVYLAFTEFCGWEIQAWHICAGKGKKFCCYKTDYGTESIVEWNLKHHQLLLLLLWVVCVLLSLQKCLETPLENFTWDLKHLNHSPYVEFLTSITTFQQIRTTEKENECFVA